VCKVRVAAFSISLDGSGAGPHQDADNPLGVRGLELHKWLLNTQTFDLPRLGFVSVRTVSGENATHVLVQKR
jgi:hypothetical protein